jgi:DnaJ-class molecular chaperone
MRRRKIPDRVLTITKWCRHCGGSGIFNDAKCDLCKGDGLARMTTCLGIDCSRKFSMRHRFDKICPCCVSRLVESQFEPYRVICGR